MLVGWMMGRGKGGVIFVARLALALTLGFVGCEVGGAGGWLWCLLRVMVEEERKRR